MEKINSNISAHTFLKGTILFLMFIIVACDNSSKKEIVVENNTTIERRHRIITLDEAKAQLKENNIRDDSLFRNMISAEFSVRNIEATYSLLSMSIHNYNLGHKNSEPIALDSYRFYIVPTTNEKGDLIVYVKAYCYDKEEEWLNYSDLFMVYDGGNCYFRTSFQISNKSGPTKLGVIIANGEA